ncbi:hypothetical protein Mapa_001979 [Marchantia paleacea]|nr:hypothetical protein Mapa_001979 [Marchantia paleacea]
MAKAVAEVLRLAVMFVMAAILLQIPIFSGFLRLSDFHDACQGCHGRSSASSSQGQLQQVDQEMCGNGSTTAIPQSRKLKPLGKAQYPFILFSVYRYALNTFFVIGETSLVVRAFEQDKPVYSCEWSAMLPNGTVSDLRTITEAHMIYVKFDENGMGYGPALVNCTFNESIGSDGLGGVLRLHVARGPHRLADRFSVEDVLHEGARAPASAARKVSKYAFCGPPMYGTMKPLWIQHWLAYHVFLWKADVHFYFYNIGGVQTAKHYQVLEPYVMAGLLTLIEIESTAIDEFPAWYNHQLLFINDCIHRTRTAGHSWSFFNDFDELLYFSPPHTVDSLIRDNPQAAWMTFGNMPASTGHCAIREESRWPIERLMWHNKVPECMKAERDPWLCTGSQGRRKYMVNPSKVFSSGVHRIAIPEDGGVDLNGSVARVIHFHGVLSPRTHVCGIPVNMSHSRQVNDLNNRYDFDESISDAVDKAREFARSRNLLTST